MGDRGNIAVQFDGDKNKRVWFYTHWTGSKIDETIAAALERGQNRWRDDNYLARIIFCELTKPDPNGTTGFGIGPEPSDNGYSFLPRLESDLVPVPFIQFIAKHATKQPA